MFLGTVRSFLFCILLKIGLFRCSCCLYRRDWCYRAWSTSGGYMNSLDRNWRAAIARSSILHHHTFAGLSESSFGSLMLSFLKLIYWSTDAMDASRALALSLRAFISTPWRDWLLTPQPIVMLPPARRVLNVFFIVGSCWCLPTTIFRCTCASAFSCYAQLWLTLLCSSVP